MFSRVATHRGAPGQWPCIHSCSVPSSGTFGTMCLLKPWSGRRLACGTWQWMQLVLEPWRAQGWWFDNISDIVVGMRDDAGKEKTVCLSAEMGRR